MEGNWYFPPDAVKKEYFKDSAHTSVCSWKGNCKNCYRLIYLRSLIGNYHTLEVNGQKNENAVWVYRDPKVRNVTLCP